MNILIVEHRTDASSMIREVFKSLGFQQIQRVTNVKEAISLIEVEFVGTPFWVVSSLLADETYTAFQFLIAFLRNEFLHECRVSLLLDVAEKYCLPHAFELGLLSWHNKQFTKGSLLAELKGLMTALTIDPSKGCWTAANGLRTYLHETKNYKSLVELESSLLHFFPGNLEFYTNLAEAHSLNGEDDKAMKLLYQVRSIEGSFNKKGTDLLDKLQTTNDGSSDIAFAESFGLKCCVIVQSHDADMKLVSDAVKSLGFPKIEPFVDGISAWEWLEKNPEPDLIIHEWKIPKLSGSALLQRYRQKGYHKMSTLVFSSLVKKEDEWLLREMGVDQVLKKPAGVKDVVNCIKMLVRQNASPSNIKNLQAEIRQAFSREDLERARILITQIEGMKDTPVGAVKALQAEFAYHEGNYEKAEQLAVEALKLDSESLSALSLLGKTMLRTGNFDGAVKVFNRAQQFSPANLERLCLLAEAEAELGNDEDSQKNLQSAESVDATSQRVIASKVNIALAEGDENKARKLFEQVETMTDILSFSNNKAVLLAKRGDLAQSRALYEKVLESIPANKKDLKPILYYNMAFNYIRANQLTQAEAQLSKALASGYKNAEKLRKLRGTIQKAINAGTNVNLRGSQITAGVDEFGSSLYPGELCCYRVYVHPNPKNEKVAALTEKTIKVNLMANKAS